MARRHRTVALPRVVTLDDIVSAVVALDMALPWLCHYPRLTLEAKADTAKAMRRLRDRLTGGHVAAR